MTLPGKMQTPNEFTYWMPATLAHAEHICMPVADNPHAVQAMEHVWHELDARSATVPTGQAAGTTHAYVVADSISWDAAVHEVQAVAEPTQLPHGAAHGLQVCVAVLPHRPDEHVGAHTPVVGSRKLPAEQVKQFWVELQLRQPWGQKPQTLRAGSG